MMPRRDAVVRIAIAATIAAGCNAAAAADPPTAPAPGRLGRPVIGPPVAVDAGTGARVEPSRTATLSAGRRLQALIAPGQGRLRLFERSDGVRLVSLGGTHMSFATVRLTPAGDRVHECGLELAEAQSRLLPATGSGAPCAAGDETP